MTKQGSNAMRATAKIFLAGIVLVSMTGSAASVDLNSSYDLRYFPGSNLQFEVQTDGQINAQNQLNMGGSNIDNPGQITNYWGSACSTGDVVESINDNGTLNCVTPQGEVEDLSETLTAGNTANQTINMGDNSIINADGVDSLRFELENSSSDSTTMLQISESSERVYIAPQESGSLNFNKEITFDPSVGVWAVEGGLGVDSGSLDVTVSDDGESTSFNSSTDIAIEKGDDSFIEFLGPGGSNTRQGLLFSDNTEVAGYIDYEHNGGGDTANYLKLGGYEAISFEVEGADGLNKAQQAKINSAAFDVFDNQIRFSTGGVEIGNSSTNTGINQDVAIGRGAVANDLSGNDDLTVAVGDGANASSYGATAIGSRSLASGGENTVIGDESSSSGYGATAIGQTANAGGYRDTALGRNSNAGGTSSLALGADASATGYRSSAIGIASSASSTGSVAIGNNAVAPNANEATFGNLSGGELDVNITGDATIHGSGGLDMKSNQINNLATPTESDDAATKQYVDDNAGGGTEGLAATLEANNTANQSIDMGGNGLSSVSSIGGGGSNIQINDNIDMNEERITNLAPETESLEWNLNTSATGEEWSKLQFNDANGDNVWWASNRGTSDAFQVYSGQINDYVVNVDDDGDFKIDNGGLYLNEPSSSDEEVHINGGSSSDTGVVLENNGYSFEMHANDDNTFDIKSDDGGPEYIQIDGSSNDISLPDSNLDMSANNIDNVNSIDNAGSAVGFDDDLNFRGGYEIQVQGTNAINFDTSQNVQISNGNLDMSSNDIQNVGSSNVDMVQDSTDGRFEIRSGGTEDICIGAC